MKFLRVATPLMATALFAGIGILYATPALAASSAPWVAFAGQGPGYGPGPGQGYGPGPGYGPGYNWDTPPGEYREFQQRGFHDGIIGAQKDYENHRPFTPENRSEYRHPHVPPNVWEDYRQAFREGYHRAVDNLYHAGPR